MGMVKVQSSKFKVQKRKGLAAVEFALVALPLLLLAIGLIDYGWIFLKAQQITQAARAGARAAALPDCTDAKVTAAIQAVMTEAGIKTYSANYTPSNKCGDGSVKPGTAIKVVLTVHTDQLALINTNLVPMPAELTAAASMAKEGT